MWPEFRVVLPGGWLVVVSTHGALATCALGAGLWFAGRTHRSIAAIVAAAALLGAQVGFWLTRGGTTPVAWTSGLASMGGIAAGLVMTWVGARVVGARPARAFDAIIPAGVLALGIGRIGCFLTACCYGAETSLPWGVTFPGHGAARHPLQLYSAAVDFLIVATAGRAAGPPGRRAALTLGAFALARIALECLRDPATTTVAFGVVTVAQLVCFVYGCAAARTLRS